MPGRRHRLAQRRRTIGLGQEQLAEKMGVDRSTVVRWERGDTVPQPWHRPRLADALGISIDELAGLLDNEAISGRADPAAMVAVSDDGWDALELSRRATASDVSDEVLDQLEQVADALATAYASTPPGRLLADVRRNLRYVTDLLGARATLGQHRRLLVIGGWFSLLGATLHIDLRQQPAAVALLSTTEQLAHQAGHSELQAWCRETRAWSVLTDGDYREAVLLSQQAQALAPEGSSAYVQATAQEGRAWARLGDAANTRRTLARLDALVSPLSRPDRPEHHFRYDPGKAISYTATTLAWVRDPAAADYAREAVRELESTPDGIRRPRRIASAQLDLSLALLAADQPDEASTTTLSAIASGRIVPSNFWRVAEVVTGVANIGIGEARQLTDAYRTLVASGEPGR